MGTNIVNQNIIEQILPTYSNEIVNYNPNIINTLKTDKYQSIIEFTEENMEDLKAQLAINTFSNMINTSTLELKESMTENIKEIA